jgi:hypothetical protein
LLNVRQRNSLCFTATNAVDSQQAQAFELLLNCCKTIDDVAFFRAHPADQLATQMGICPEKLATLLEVFIMGSVIRPYWLCFPCRSYTFSWPNVIN